MSNPKPTIRKATDADLLDVAMHYEKGENSPWYPFTSLERLRKIPLNGLYIAEIEGEYAGFLYWFEGKEKEDDSNVDRFAFIYEIFVRKKFWGKMVGQYLELEAYREIDRLKIPVIYTQVFETNKALIAQYEQIGFTTYGRTRHMRYLYPIDPTRKSIPHDEALELAVFMVELKEQCRMLSTTYGEILSLIKEGPPGDLEGNRHFHARIWSRIQSILSATAAITRIIWPNPFPKEDGSDKRAIRRGLEMRRFLGLQGTRSHFPTDVRNAFEHIDDRIPVWLVGQNTDNPWGWSLSPFEKGKDPPGVGTALRYFNINTKELRVAGSSCNLREISYIAKEIEKRIPSDAQVHYKQIDDWDPDKGRWKGDIG